MKMRKDFMKKNIFLILLIMMLVLGGCTQGDWIQSTLEEMGYTVTV